MVSESEASKAMGKLMLSAQLTQNCWFESSYLALATALGHRCISMCLFEELVCGLR